MGSWVYAIDDQKIVCESLNHGLKALFGVRPQKEDDQD